MLDQGNVTEGGLKSSIHRFIWEQAFLPIERGKRDIVKATIIITRRLIMQTELPRRVMEKDTTA